MNTSFKGYIEHVMCPQVRRFRRGQVYCHAGREQLAGTVAKCGRKYQEYKITDSGRIEFGASLLYTNYTWDRYEYLVVGAGLRLNSRLGKSQ